MKNAFMVGLMFSALILIGCGEEGKAGSSSLMNITEESAGENCENGGKKIDAGVDKNGNGTLDEKEITATEYVCNGIDGKDGESGTDGKDGEPGSDGIDGTDGVDGIDGKDGEPGTDGKDGEPGSDGTNGNDGLKSLIRTEEEAAGENCEHGGVKVLTGIDDNNDDYLDDDEVDDTAYVCNGASQEEEGCSVEHEIRYMACGYNFNGIKRQICDGTNWQDMEECNDPDECVDGQTKTISCGTGDTGTQNQVCTEGAWVNDGNCKITELGILCTGETKCYNNSTEITCPSVGNDFYGQDSQYAELGYCTAKSFTVSGTSPEEIVVDNNTVLQWQRTISTDTYTWQNALNYCDNLSYGGYNDWRLPISKELETIVDYGKSDPAVNTDIFSISTTITWIWSSDINPNETGKAFGFYFEDGNTNAKEKTFSGGVTCVRGDTIQIYNDFSEMESAGGVVVKDNKTNLIWTKSYASGKTWQESLNYCQNLEYAGDTDWRLPTVNELKTLVDRSEYHPSSKFPDMPSSRFWSSTSNIIVPGNAWGVYFTAGGVHGSYPKMNSYFEDGFMNARCVRSENLLTAW